MDRFRIAFVELRYVGLWTYVVWSQSNIDSVRLQVSRYHGYRGRMSHYSCYHTCSLDTDIDSLVRANRLYIYKQET